MRERERERNLTWKYTVYDPYLIIHFCLFIWISRLKRIKSFSYKCIIEQTLRFHVFALRRKCRLLWVIMTFHGIFWWIGAMMGLPSAMYFFLSIFQIYSIHKRQNYVVRHKKDHRIYYLGNPNFYQLYYVPSPFRTIYQSMYIVRKLGDM